MDIVLMGRLGGSGLRGLLGWYGRDDRRAAREALRQVGMEGLARRPLASLSGGQRQRVLIARAMCCQPELLLLDEPTSNIDTLVEARLFEILREINRRMTVVVVSHDLGFVSDLVEKVICVNRQVVVHPTSQAHRRVDPGNLRRRRSHGPPQRRHLSAGARGEGGLGIRD